MRMKYQVHEDLQMLLQSCAIVTIESREDLLHLLFKDNTQDVSEVYSTINNRKILEATVTRCKNGIVVNYTETYMRRRDPHALVVADDLPSDKTRFSERFSSSFSELRKKTYQWLKEQKELIALPFYAGGPQLPYPSLLIAPLNTAFFVLILADLQGFIPESKVPNVFNPRSVILLAPHFRHSFFKGKQVVVHNRLDDIHEVFSYNLYPGPSAKKGVYGILLDIGEKEGWCTLHSASVRLLTPYDNDFVILHEGASGGGKSEMTQLIQRGSDGKICLGQNIISSHEYLITLQDTCQLYPITDDMSLTHPTLQSCGNSRKLAIKDAEEGWFLRVNHIDKYGIETQVEKLSIHPPKPLVFLNIEAHPRATALIWEPIEDEPGTPCPNPRVIIPRNIVPHVINEVVSVDVRSFGVRTPPCTRENPNYGIIGMFHILPPALAWLWRLAAPRGHDNPSIIGSEGLTSEGVGTFWPFAVGKKAQLANILLQQIQDTPETGYVLIPNQYIGAYKVGFMPEWIVREYLARRGSIHFRPEQLNNCVCPLLGYMLPSLKINGQKIPLVLLDVEKQMEVGQEAYQIGATMITNFFKQELSQYKAKELSHLGKEIIDVCLDDGTLHDYASLIPERS